VNRLSQDLWNIWLKIYLQTLNFRKKWTRPASDLKAGDVVFVRDETLCYQYWPVARITQTYPESDGHVCTVDLRCGGKIFQRPIAKLIPLLKEEQIAPSPLSPQDGGDYHSPQDA